MALNGLDEGVGVLERVGRRGPREASRRQAVAVARAEGEALVEELAQARDLRRRRRLRIGQGGARAPGCTVGHEVRRLGVQLVLVGCGRPHVRERHVDRLATVRGGVALAGVAHEAADEEAAVGRLVTGRRRVHRSKSIARRRRRGIRRGPPEIHRGGASRERHVRVRARRCVGQGGREAGQVLLWRSGAHALFQQAGEVEVWRAEGVQGRHGLWPGSRTRRSAGHEPGPRADFPTCSTSRACGSLRAPPLLPSRRRACVRSRLVPQLHKPDSSPEALGRVSGGASAR
mmetsp:Transcript_13915/g.51933  ORF Transcript_13915/g.51933 Transcript_13915/m.51933 type:complete len:288 (-) Transcript_13915:182-1045(-)